MKNIPKFSMNKKTGKIAVEKLKSILSNFAIINPHDEDIDLGIDLRGQIIKNEYPESIFFNIQVKGTNKKIEENNGYLSHQINISTLNFWKLQNEVTFLFLVDISNDNCYWSYPFENLDLNKINSSNCKSISIKIPISNIINRETKILPNNFYHYIIKYHIENLNKIPKLMESINEMLKLNTSNSLIENKYSLVSLEKNINIINKSFLEIKETISKNIELIFDKTFDFFIILDHIPEVKYYCPDGIFNDNSFKSKNNKSFYELKQEAEVLIKELHMNLCIDVIEKLLKIHEEILEYGNNAGYFSIEMLLDKKDGYSLIKEVTKDLKILNSFR